jgi:hypothetical protein
MPLLLPLVSFLENFKKWSPEPPGCNYEEYCPMWSDVMQSGSYLPTFRSGRTDYICRVVPPSDTLVNLCETARRHTPENINLESIITLQDLKIE